MPKILITGGAGFIGFHLACHLNTKQYQVDILDNLSRGVQDAELKALVALPNVRFLELDLLSQDAVIGLDKDYDNIFHLAAIIGVSHVLRRPYAVLKDNIDMLGNILCLAKEQKELKRFVFASTSEVYAGTLKYFELPIPTPEDTPLAVTDLSHPRSSYMLSKIYGEAMCQHSGIPFTIIRPHNIYGPRMGLSHVIPELLQRAYFAGDAKELEVYSVNHSRTFCFIQDAVEMIGRAVETEKCKDETLNIGTEKPEIRIGDLASHVLKTVGKDLSVKGLASTQGSPARRCPDMSKTASLTGYSARCSIKVGLEKTFSWYRENVFQGQGICSK